MLPAILSCLGSPQSAIHGGLTLSSVLRLADFQRDSSVSERLVFAVNLKTARFLVASKSPKRFP
ncbi:hypothetical protein CEW81_19630 [Kluyvera genomosp. 3]|uniref:Uncharacterized protein n=1 Tax=Kluyvera genomosp. 3 TaxID=2774055 RepID=A0A248KL79_9ENTR|nr:hypothetical protein CEW81_19630 [Kluyvera genomosp. 3]